MRLPEWPPICRCNCIDDHPSRDRRTHKRITRRHGCTARHCSDAAGNSVATVGINGSLNAAILAVQMIATGDESLQQKLAAYKDELKVKITQANEELANIKYKFKTN